MENMKSLTRRQKYTLLSGGITLAITVVILLVNVITIYLTDKYPITIDLTSEKAFEISDQTKEYLETLSKPVTITILNSEDSFLQGGNYYKQALTVLKKYEMLSPQINIAFEDILKNPSIAAQYDSNNVSVNDIVIESGSRTRFLTAYDIFNIETGYYGDYITSSKAEQAVTSAIMGVTSDTQVKVGFLSGHGERDEHGLQNLLSLNNFDVVTIVPAVEPIAEDVDVLILSAPTSDPDEQVLQKLSDFLALEGKTLFYFASVTQPSLPRLDKFLAQWGIQVGDGTIIETDRNKTMNFNQYLSTTTLSDDALSSTMHDVSTPMTMPFSRPLSVLYQQSMGRYTTVLMHSSETSLILPLDADENWQPAEEDYEGYLPIAILSQYYFDEDTTSQVVAVGSADSLTEAILSSGSFGNSDFYLSAFNTVTKREDVINIEAKVLGGQELGITTSQAFTIGILFMVALPTAMILIGFTIWYQRRNR